LNKLKIIEVSDLDDAIKLDEEYNLYDLRKVMQALNDAVKDKKYEKVEEMNKEMNVIFENVWEEASKFMGRVGKIRHAIPFGVAVMGQVAAGPIGGVAGLLAGLGFEAFEEIVDAKYSKGVANWFAKWNTPNYVVHVYDFREKYRL